MIDENSCASPLTESEVTALADGSIEVLSVTALEHAERCESCAARVADHALLSISVGTALVALASSVAAEEKQPPLPSRPVVAPLALAPIPSPTRPILIALVVAGLASLPLVSSLGNSGLMLLATGRVYRQAAWQGLTAVVASLNGPIWTFSVAVGLVALSALVARFSNRFSSHDTEAPHGTEPPHGTEQEGALK